MGILLRKKGFVRNFTVLTFSNLIVNAIGVIVNIVLARSLTPNGFGAYSVFITVTLIFSTLSSLGIQQIVIRTIARSQENSKPIFYTSLLIRFFGLLVTGLFLVLYLLYVKDDYNFQLILLTVLYFTSLSVWDGFQNLAFGMQRMEFSAYINVLASLIFLIIIFLIKESYLNLENAVIFLVIVQFFKVALFLFSIKKSSLLTCSDCSSRLNIGEVKVMLSESVPYLILSVFTLLTTQVPVLFLERNSDIAQVAYFNGANKLLIPIILLINTLMTSLFPGFSKIFVTDRVRFMEIVEDSLVALVSIGVVLVFLFTLFRGEIVNFLYGDEYANSAKVMLYQGWYVLMFAVYSFIGNVLGASNQQKLLSFLSIAYTVVAMPILWYTSYSGAEVLSIGYIVLSLLNFSYHYYFFQKVLPEKIPFSNILKLIVIFLTVFFIAVLLPEIFPVYLKILIFITIAFVVFLLNKDIVSKYLPLKIFK